MGWKSERTQCAFCREPWEGKSHRCAQPRVIGGIATKTDADRPPLTAERLAEIRERHIPRHGYGCWACREPEPCDVAALLIEVDRLLDQRDELQATVDRLTLDLETATRQRDEYKALVLASEGVLVDAPALAAKERERAERAETALKLSMLRWVGLALVCDGCQVTRLCSEQEYLDRRLVSPFEHLASCILAARSVADDEGQGGE